MGHDVAFNLICKLMRMHKYVCQQTASHTDRSATSQCLPTPPYNSTHQFECFEVFAEVLQHGHRHACEGMGGARTLTRWMRTRFVLRVCNGANYLTLVLNCC